MAKQIEREIECRICKLTLNVKTVSSHLRTHGIKFKDYVQHNLDQFPNHQTRPCQVCGKETKNEKVCSKKCLKIYLSENYSGDNSPIKGRERSKEHCESLSIAAKERLKDKTKHPMYGRHHTKETKAKVSKIRKEQGNFWDGKHHTEESKKKISETRIKRKVAVGKNNGMFGKTHTPEAIKKIFSHKKMNKLEKIVADVLDKANIKYYFQFFITENDICKSYDFKIKGRPIILEIDGDFWHNNTKTIKQKNRFLYYEQTQKNDKIKNEMAKRNGYELHRFWGSDIKKDPNLILQVL